MTWRELAGSELSYYSSAKESRRFGLPIGRVTVGFEAPASAGSALTRIMASALEDLLVVRWPSERLCLPAAAVASGRTIIPADTLVYWEARAGTVMPLKWGAFPGDLACTTASVFPGDPQAAVAEIVRDSFRAYGNHYLANPALAPDLALEGYISWAQRALESDSENVLILTLANKAVGVATLSVDPSGRDLEVLLAGIVGRHQAKGWYQPLFAAVDREAIERGCERVIISTQSHNVRVQRAWVKLGLRPFAAITTVHAMRQGALRGADRSVRPPRSEFLPD